MKGEVKSYSKAHGYGFVIAGDEYWFHATEWQEKGIPQVGDKVDFVPTETGKGKRALLIRRLDNGK